MFVLIEDADARELKRWAIERADFYNVKFTKPGGGKWTPQDFGAPAAKEATPVSEQQRKRLGAMAAAIAFPDPDKLPAWAKTRKPKNNRRMRTKPNG